MASERPQLVTAIAAGNATIWAQADRPLSARGGLQSGSFRR